RERCRLSGRKCFPSPDTHRVLRLKLMAQIPSESADLTSMMRILLDQICEHVDCAARHPFHLGTASRVAVHSSERAPDTLHMSNDGGNRASAPGRRVHSPEACRHDLDNVLVHQTTLLENLKELLLDIKGSSFRHVFSNPPYCGPHVSPTRCQPGHWSCWSLKVSVWNCQR